MGILGWAVVIVVSAAVIVTVVAVYLETQNDHIYMGEDD